MTPPDIPLATLRQIAVNATEIREGDRERLTEQLGREPRGLVGIGARCACGDPAVTITYPRLPDGSPFPTLFYLSLPWLVKEISRQESAGEMVAYNERLASDPEFAAAHEAAHQSFVARRDLLDVVPEIADKSAGGMPDRVKCLHALVGFALAVGPGVCPAGDMALDAAGWDPQVCRCNKSDDDKSDDGDEAAKLAGAGAGTRAGTEIRAGAGVRAGVEKFASAAPNGDAAEQPTVSVNEPKDGE
ncbi:MAG: DUF501 domain-containing protein [Actinomycetaceae bacterium]|nr:DUF501 domain-containing protein [Actinomycetaceae bacterium]